MSGMWMWVALFVWFCCGVCFGAVWSTYNYKRYPCLPSHYHLTCVDDDPHLSGVWCRAACDGSHWPEIMEEPK